MKLSTYNPNWQKRFEAEKELLRQVFGDAILEIEHIGSTAVEGLYAKPIIDIAVMIEKHGEADSFTEALAEMGYSFHSKSTERHFYQKSEPRSYNLSIAYADRGGFWPRQILFRDYLRSHPEAAAEYVKLKEDLINKYPSGMGGYSDGKTDFVQKILLLAGWKEGQKYKQ